MHQIMRAQLEHGHGIINNVLMNNTLNLDLRRKWRRMMEDFPKQNTWCIKRSYLSALETIQTFVSRSWLNSRLFWPDQLPTTLWFIFLLLQAKDVRRNWLSRCGPVSQGMASYKLKRDRLTGFKKNHQMTRSITLWVIENRGAGPGSFLRQTLIQIRISETNVSGN